MNRKNSLPHPPYSNIRAEKEATDMENRIHDDLFDKNGFKVICKNFCQ